MLAESKKIYQQYFIPYLKGTKYNLSKSGLGLYCTHHFKFIYLPVSKAWSTLSVVDLIVVIRISAGTLSPTAKKQNKKKVHIKFKQ